MILLRSALFNALFPLLTFVMGLWGLVIRAGIALRLLARDRAFDLARAWCRAALALLEALCGIRAVVSGLEHLPPDGGPALIAAQHQSAFDTLIWTVLLRRPTYVLKRELTWVPLFGPLLVATGQIAVDRAAGPSAVRTLLRAADRAVAERRQIVIFPEGTRADPGAPVRLQPGIAALAARTGLPVIPAATDSGLRWGRRAFLKRPGPVHLALLSPLPPGLGRDELLARIERAWADGAARFARAVENSVG